MAAHSIGSATISFGLVSVPIKMFSAGESSAAISFNWLHKKDGARLKQQYICSKDGEKVDNDDRVKGYEFSKGQYVVFSVDELKKLQMDDKSSNSMNITEFVDAATVDRMYMDRAYFLGPDKGGERAFGLLGEALKKTGKVAIGQWAARGKQYLIMIRPLASGLVMEQLRYADEVRSIKDVPIEKMDLKKSEIDLAVQLIQQLAGREFQPAKYEDEVKKRILEQIERKVQGKEITEEPTEAPKTQIIDLMEALKASLAKGKGPAGAERKPAKRAEPLLHTSRLPFPRAQRAGGSALHVSGSRAVEGREGTAGSSRSRRQDPRLPASPQAAAAARACPLGGPHHRRGASCGRAGRCDRVESGIGATGAGLRRGDAGAAGGAIGA